MWTCNVCEKEGARANIKTHIEANHNISSVIFAERSPGQKKAEKHRISRYLFTRDSLRKSAEHAKM